MKPLGNSMNATQILFANSTGRNGLVNGFLNKMTETFNLNLSYAQVTKTINGVSSPTLYDTWIMDKDSYKEPTSKKKIIMKPGQSLNRGDIINWNNQSWLVTNMDMQVFPYDEGELEYCNDILKCILPNGKYFQTPCIITSVSKRSMTVEKDGTLMESQKMPFFVTIQNSDDSKLINPSYRFLFGRLAYKATDFDDISMKGTLIMLVTANQNRPTDDFVLGIADNSIAVIPPITGTLILQGSSTISLNTTQNYKVIYDNGTLATGTFIFTIDKPTVGQLTVIDGLNVSIKGILSGQCKFTATQGATVITKIISVSSGF